jgi:AAA+ superfamily predicted ATPase
MRASIANDLDTPKGVSLIRRLPDPELRELWDSIQVAPDLKDRLAAQAVLNFTLRPKVPRSVVPLHGVILLVGPPGTGKTSLARGLANRVASSFDAPRFRLLEVEPHSPTSSALGKSQRAVAELFGQTLAEAAQAGPTIVLLDEVETLAVDRSKLSMDANPVDVHRATDAVLVQLDALAASHPNLLFIATSNFPEAIDGAFLSRCDLVVDVPLPDAAACEAILADCLAGLAKQFPAIGKIPPARVKQCAKECQGLDGRAIRKMIVSAIASSIETALNPEKVDSAALIAAAKAAKQAMAAAKGKIS